MFFPTASGNRQQIGLFTFKRIWVLKVRNLPGRSGGTGSRLRAAFSTPAAGEHAVGADGLRPQLSREGVIS